jgi:hypothetical protein
MQFSWETRRSCYCAKGCGVDGSAIRKQCTLDGNERSFSTEGGGECFRDGLNRKLCGFQVWSMRGGEERNLCSVGSQFSSTILLLVTGLTELFWLLTALQIVIIVDVL